MYTQGSEPQGSLLLGTSSCTCAQYGCLATDMAQALSLSGWNVTPEDFILKMNANGGFTNEGLLIWAKVGELYPQFHLDQGTEYTFQEGSMGHLTHWVLKANETVYDPLWGANVEPSGFHETSYHRTATIDAAPVEVTDVSAQVETFAPFEVNLAPSQTYNAEVERVQKFLKMPDLGTQYGYYGKKTQAAVDTFQKSHGILGATEYGWWYDKTRDAANTLLTNQQSA